MLLAAQASLDATASTSSRPSSSDTHASGSRSSSRTSGNSSSRSPPLPSPEYFVFFPTPLPEAPEQADPDVSSSRTYLYGWRGEGCTVVAGSLRARDTPQAQVVLRSALATPARHEIEVLGTCIHRHYGKGKGRLNESLVDEPGALCVEVSPGEAPVILACESDRCTIVLYTPPNRANLQFLSLEPLQLDLNSFTTPFSNSPAARVSPITRRRRPPDEGPSENQLLSKKLRQSCRLDFTRRGRPCSSTNLTQVVDWINVAPHLTARLSPSSPSLRTTLRLPPWVKTFLTSSRHFASCAACAVLSVTNRELPVLGGTALKDLSATVQQIDTRLTQALSWPSQYNLIRQTLSPSAATTIDKASLSLGRAHYIQFYNTMWLIANDVIVGSAFTSFVCENSEYLGIELGRIVQVYTLDSLRELLLWLNDWPGGVKLNFELASMFCDGFLWGTGLWEQFVLARILPHLPLIVYLLGLSGLFGATLFFSFASDLLAVLTFHVFVFYLMATSLFRWHLLMLGTLFNIFRGKKFNALRNRVEPAVYETDQLLLGTILFTLAAFLFPTVLVYYLAFASSRLGIIVLHAAMEAGLAFMNHFPLFAVMLRLKDPARLPGGLNFDLVVPGSASPQKDCPVPSELASTPYLRMRNHPIGLAGIFFQHLQLSRRLASHYSPLYLLGRVLVGRVISPIPRVRLRLDVTTGPDTSESALS